MRFPKSLAIATALTMALAACSGGGSETEEPAPENTTAGAEDVTTDEVTDDEDVAEDGDMTADLEGEIRFQTWSLKNDRFTPYFEGVIADFEEMYPNVTVEWMDQPGDGYEDKILQQANSNQLPDVINLPPEFAYKLAQVDQLVDLSSLDNNKLSDYVEGATEAYSYPNIEGHYAYPWYLGTDLNWWNMEELEKAGVTEADLPTDLDGLFELASKVAAETNGEVKLISESPRTGTFSAAGVPIFENGEFVFNTPEAAEIIDMHKKAYEEGAMPAEALSGDYLGNSTLFKQGKVAWTTASAGLASEIRTDAPNLVEKIKVTPRIGHAPLFIQGISVAKTSEHPDVAAAFAEFVTNNENQVEFLKIAQGFFPGTQEGNDNPESFTSVIEDDLQKQAVEAAASAIGSARPEYPIQYTYDMDTYLRQQVALAVRGDISAQEALDKSVEYANANTVE